VVVAEVQPPGGPHAGQDAPRRRRRTHVTDRAVAHELNYSASRPVIGPRSPLPLRTISGGVTDRSTTVVARCRSPRHREPHRSRARVAPRISRPRGQGLRIGSQQQGRAHQRLAQFGEQQPRHRVIGDAHADWCAVARAAGGACVSLVLRSRKVYGPGQAGGPGCGTARCRAARSARPSARSAATHQMSDDDGRPGGCGARAPVRPFKPMCPPSA